MIIFSDRAASGYKDAYEQTRKYMDWFSSSEKFNNKKVYGMEYGKWIYELQKTNSSIA